MWARWLASVVLGLPLAVAAVGLCALLLPGPRQSYTLAWLLLMFPVWIGAMAWPFAFRSAARAWLWLGTLAWLLLMFPVWIGAMAWPFAFRSAARAWLWLGGLTVLCYLALAAVKALGWTELQA
ncbi:hypothetical protein [Xanthomonas dyei]|uniref:hypothetical protein n=1 Tax=Xanthomonas dyei TaxID=743699 RepID=UPI000E1E86E3|nr:hypothetical protein [Xanthomonas dyei]